MFSSDELDARHAGVNAAKANLRDTVKRRPSRTTEVINRETGQVTRVPQVPGPVEKIVGLIAAYPVATAAITFGLMAAFGPLRLIRLGILAGRGVGMVMAAKKAAQSVDVLS